MQLRIAYRLPAYLVCLLLALLSRPGEAAGWRQAAYPLEPRTSHTATLLSNGSVLVVGGQSTMTGAILSSAEIYNPVLDRWTPAGALKQARYRHTATLLASGRVLVAGGDAAADTFDTTLATAEIYDPATDRWSTVNRLRTARAGHTATALADGRVLVVGGANFAGGRILYDINEAEIFDERGLSWTSGGLMTARVEHTATRLQTGEVAVVGGESSYPHSLVEIFSPATTTWRTASSLFVARRRHAAVLAPDGSLIVTGGLTAGFFGVEMNERYDPGLDRWSTATPMLKLRTGHTMVSLATGNVLSIGGGSVRRWYDEPLLSDSLPDVESFNVAAADWSSRPPLSSMAGAVTAVALNDGQVLAVNAGRAEIYSEDRPPNLGTVDGTYGVLGRSTTLLPGYASNVTVAALDRRDNSMIVVSACMPQLTSYCVVRVDASGRPNATFGNQGSVVGSNLRVTGVAVQSDGKILLAGNCASTTLCVARLGTDGTVDQSFGNGGLLTVDADRTWTNARVASLADGRFVVGGGCKDADGSWSFCTARYRANAIRDASYAGGAIAMLSSGLPGLMVQSVTTQRDGTVVVGAVCGRKHAFSAYVVLDYTGCAAKFTNTGVIDTGFGVGALAMAAFPDGFSTVITVNYSDCCILVPADAAVLDDGRVIVATRCTGDARNMAAVCVARWRVDGTPDTSFGVNGRLAVPAASRCLNNVYSRMTALPDGRVVLLLLCAAQPGTYQGEPLRTMRLQADGQVDATFSNSIGSAFLPAAMFALPSQDVVAVGQWTPTGNRAEVVSYRLLGQAPSNLRPMVEYRYAPLDYYFITARSNEQALLDSTAGWSRTGERFNAYDSAATGLSGLTRFYFEQVARGASRGSHFYTLLASEVSAVQALNPGNVAAPGKPVNEGIDGYASAPGTDGSCPSGTAAVYRLFRGNARFPDDPNHRFTARRSLYDQFVAAGWDGEGVKLCAPVE